MTSTFESKERRRASFAWLVLLVPGALVLCCDLSWRFARLRSFQGEEVVAYLSFWIRGALTWALLLLASSARPPSESRSSRRFGMAYAAFFLLAFSLTLSGQGYFFGQYRSYFNVEVSRFATDFTESVLSQLWADRTHFLSYFALGLVGAAGLLVLARKILLPSARTLVLSRVLAPGLFTCALFLPVSHRHRQPAPPDLLYLTGAGGVLKTQLGLAEDSGKLRPRARKSLPVPRLIARPSAPRNVVFVILESVRKDATCTEPESKCNRTGATHALFAERYPLNQMRALDSSTAISMAVLLSGLGPHEDRETLHTWPLVFDYARAAGYFTAFWTSQSLLFGNLGLWYKNFGVDSFFSASDVDPESDIDLGAAEDKFADAGLRRLSQLREPFFLTIQLSNGHYPYLVQEQYKEPFQPATKSKAPDHNEEFKNHYQNAIHQQDLHLARLLRGVMSLPSGQRTVIVYTSDHGEAFREHHQMGHTFSVLDEEVLVPAWIYAPDGTLSEQEQESLRSKRNAFTFHPDLTVTLLDLLGVFELPEIERYSSRLLGTSLLSPALNLRALPLTNCASVWTCAFENWGVMQGSKKLEARAWDSSYHCWDLVLDPGERNDLGEASCPELKAVADSTFGRRPGKGAVSAER